MRNTATSLWALAGLIALTACASESKPSGAVTTSTTSPSASERAMEADVEALLTKIKSEKKQMVAANMNLTATEGKQFWPLYDSYQENLDLINERLARTISTYAEELEQGPLTDKTAEALLEESLAIEEAELALRQSHAERLSQVLPASKVARYLQIENKIRSALKFGLARGIPLAY
ncbi:hypothetical protein YTPLAS18_28920 [Nitrospira sp.]|nr:hypothetical protein YTPLAS18_28920 [Nitrospira sp.]